LLQHKLIVNIMYVSINKKLIRLLKEYTQFHVVKTKGKQRNVGGCTS
jgi:hypothetical protein